MTAIAHSEIWSRIREEALRDAEREPMLASFLQSAIVCHRSLEDALSTLLAEKLGGPALTARALCDLIGEAIRSEPAIGAAARADLAAAVERDPACRGYSAPFLYFKGFHSLQAHRIAHRCWATERRALALYLQSRTSEAFAVDIHPGARIGQGILIDHATALVIGETAVVDDDCSMLHDVTLGGTGKEAGDRHPKIRRGVSIGAGARILGNVVVGEGAKVGAGSVVLRDVPPHCTVAGVPARRVGDARAAAPKREHGGASTEMRGPGRVGPRV